MKLKMKSTRRATFALAVATLLAATFLVGPLNADSEKEPRFTLDRYRSSIEFFVNAKLVDVKGSFRSFRLDQFQFDGTNPASIQGGLVIWPASVFTRDRDRDEHLRQDDFFWVEKYPTARIALKEVKKGAEANLYDFVFTLHIRDKVKEYTVPTKVYRQSDHIYIQGEFQVNRRDFDLNGEHVANLVMNNQVDLKYTIALQDNLQK